MTEMIRIRLAGAAQGFNWLPILVADRAGLFARENVELELVRLGSVDRVTAAVRDGTADLAITPPEGAVVDHLRGGTLRIIASNSERLPMSMVARPGIADLGALRGKRIGTSSLTEGTAVYTQHMLQPLGLHYPGDYEFVLTGVHTARWLALQNGEIDAAPQPAPWNFLAAQHGYGLLGEVSDVLPEIIFAAVIGASPWLSRNRTLVARVLAVIAEAHAMVNDPAHDAVTLAAYRSVTTPDDAALAERGLTYTRDLGMWPDGARVSPAALEATIDVMVSAALISESERAAARGVVDSSYGAA